MPTFQKKCICCESQHLKSSPAILMPFVTYRIFGYKPIEIDESWGLRDLKKGTAYNICNSIQCQSCGVLFSEMRFDDNEMFCLYSGYRDQRYETERDTFEPGYAERNQKLNKPALYIPKIESFLERWIPASPKILDWGGDTGQNTPFRQKAGIHHIFDVSEKKVVDGAKIVSLDESLKEIYDIVILSEVLEHVSFPISFLEHLLPVLKKNTKLYIEVPYENLISASPNSFNLYLEKKYWHEHINFFSEKSIKILVKRLGLHILDFAIIEADSGGKKSSVFSLICEKK